jgi:hypothetical protein
MPPALDNYGQSCFVRSDFLKMKCVCKTQMMPPPDHQNQVLTVWVFKSRYDLLLYVLLTLCVNLPVFLYVKGLLD